MFTSLKDLRSSIYFVTAIAGAVIRNVVLISIVTRLTLTTLYSKPVRILVFRKSGKRLDGYHVLSHKGWCCVQNSAKVFPSCDHASSHAMLACGLPSPALDAFLLIFAQSSRAFTKTSARFSLYFSVFDGGSRTVGSSQNGSLVLGTWRPPLKQPESIDAGAPRKGCGEPMLRLANGSGLLCLLLPDSGSVGSSRSASTDGCVLTPFLSRV